MRCAARCVFEGPAALSAVRGVQGPVSSSHIRASARQVRTEDPARGVPRRVLSAALRPPRLGVLLHRARRRLHLGSEARRAVPGRTAAFIAHIPAVRARKCALGACPCIARSRALLPQVPVVRRGAWGAVPERARRVRCRAGFVKEEEAMLSDWGLMVCLTNMALLGCPMTYLRCPFIRSRTAR